MLISSSLSFLRSTSAAQSRVSLLLPPPVTSTVSGTVPGAARYDTPPPGAEVEELERSQRPRKATTRGAIWRHELCPQPRRPQLNIHASMPTRRAPNPSAPKATPSTAQTHSPSSTASSASTNSKKKSKAVHPLLTSTICGYDREELVNMVSRVVGEDCSALETQELEKILETIQNSEATQVATQEWQTQAQTTIHPPHELNVGGGFYLAAALADSPEQPPLKLTPVTSPKKRARSTQDGDNTETEEEEEDDAANSPLVNRPPPAALSNLSLRSSAALAHPRSSTTPPQAINASVSSTRPIGLPRSSINASAASRACGLPSSSARALTEVKVEVVRSSVGPERALSVPYHAAGPSSSSSTPTPPVRSVSALGQALATNNTSPLPNVMLALKELAALPSTSQAITSQQQVLLNAIQWFQNCTQATSVAGVLPPPEPAVPSPLPPYPGMAPPSLVAPPPNLVEDNEETLMAISASAAGRRVKSKKFSLSDLTGNMRQVVTGATVDYLAYICAEGPYETKRTQQIWALEACRRESVRTDAPFVNPPLEALNLIVARSPTLRFGAKERIRALIVRMFTIFDPPENEEQRLANQQEVQLLLPNAFHARDPSRPRSEQYEHPIVRRSIALLGFHSVDAVCATFYTYFNPMPLPTVAFALTTVQFCIEEWETGVFKPKELRAERQYNTYCAHLRGLQQYETAALSRMTRFRREWFEFAIQYSGINIPVSTPAQEITQSEDVRPDTPPPSPDM